MYINPKTMQIKGKNGPVTINESDFNPDVQERYVVVIDEPEIYVEPIVKKKPGRPAKRKR